jgi:signal transduction histidine kinase
MDLLLSVGEQIGGVFESAHLRAQAERLAVAEERNRLARALHDSVTQSLYSVTLFAEAGRNLAQTQAYQRASQYFDDVLQTGQQALKEMRLLVHNLRPSALEQEGLVRALQHRLNAVEGRAGIHHQLIVADDLKLPAEIEEALYHISQEALNNAIKHAFASEVTVEISQPDNDWVELHICDNGQGFDAETAAANGGLGLTSIRERVALLGGTVTYESAAEQGTRIVVQLPVSRKQ